MGVIRSMGRVALLVAMASGASSACKGAPSPTTVHCPDGDRLMLACESEVAYQGVTVDGGVQILNVASLGASFSEVAARAVDQDVERYVAAQTRLCREYDACTVDAGTYHAEAEKTRDHLLGIAKLVDQFKNSRSPAQRAAAADAIYAAAGGATGVPLSLSMSIRAIVPDAPGGAEMVVPPNYPLPTGTRVSFVVEASPAAYLYLFQVSDDKKVLVLFPNEAIAMHNPLPPAVVQRIPADRYFRLDENDVGTERLFVVASLKPIQSLDATLRRYADDSTLLTNQDPLLARITDIASGVPRPGCAERTRALRLEDQPGGDPCVTTRGLVLDDPPPPSGIVEHSIRARTAAGDDTIAKVFPFKHVTPAEYRARLRDYQAPTPEGEKTRGIIIENVNQ
jgi:hypothetical protein